MNHYLLQYSTLELWHGRRHFTFPDLIVKTNINITNTLLSCMIERYSVHTYLIQNGISHISLAVLQPGRAPRGHLDHRPTRAPHITLVGVTSAMRTRMDNFWCHEGRRAYHLMKLLMI